MLDEQIARIESTYLGDGEDSHGIFSASLYLNFGMGGRSAGGYNLTSSDSAARFIRGVLRVLQIDSWEGVKGHSVIALVDEKDQIVGLKSLPFVADESFLFESIYEAVTQ